MNRANDGDVAEVDIDTLWSRIRGRKWLFIGLALLGFLIAETYTVVNAPVWEAKCMVFFPVSGGTGLGALSSVADASAASALLGGGVTSTPLKVFHGFLETDTALNAIAKSSGVPRKKVEGMRHIEDLIQSNAITISVYNTDPDLAKRIVGLHINALRQMNKLARGLSMEDDEKTIAARIADHRAKLTALEDRFLKQMRDFKTAPVLSSGMGGTMVAIPQDWPAQLLKLKLQSSTLTASIDAAWRSLGAFGDKGPSDLPPARTIRPKIVEAETDLRLNELTLGPQAPEVRHLRDKVSNLQHELQVETAAYVSALKRGEIETSNVTLTNYSQLVAQKAVTDAQIGIVGKLAYQSPRDAIDANRLIREIAMQTAAIQQLMTQLEVTDLQVLRDPNRWVVLDPPQVEADPVNKHYGRVGVIGLIAGLAVGLLWLGKPPKGR